MKQKITVNKEIVEKPLSAIVEEIESILKPYQHKLNIEIEKKNGLQHTIRMTVEIKQ